MREECQRTADCAACGGVITNHDNRIMTDGAGRVHGHIATDPDQKQIDVISCDTGNELYLALCLNLHTLQPELTSSTLLPTL